MLKIFYKKIAFQIMGILLFVFLNLDSNTFCETIESLDSKIEENWSNWFWNNKWKILIVISGVVCVVGIGFYYFTETPHTELEKKVFEVNLKKLKAFENDLKDLKAFEIDLDELKNNIIDLEKVDNIEIDLEKVDNIEIDLEKIPNEINYDKQISDQQIIQNEQNTCTYFDIDYNFFKDCIDTIKICLPHKEFSELFEILIKLETGQLVFTEEDFNKIFLNDEILNKIKESFLFDTYKYTIQKLIDKYIRK